MTATPQIRPACEHILRRLPASVQDDDGDGDAGEQVATPALIAERRRFAECVRQHGVPRFLDPDGGGRFTNVTTSDVTTSDVTTSDVTTSDVTTSDVTTSNVTTSEGLPGIDAATVRAIDACGGKGKDLKRDLGF